MGNHWTRASTDELNNIQDQWIQNVEEDSRNNGMMVRFYQQKTTVGEENLSMYSVQCRSDDMDKDAKPIVMLHGYGAGSLLFTETMANIAHKSKRPVYAVDWVGTGSSDRTTFDPQTTEETIHFFNDYFDKWVIGRGIQSFDLIGHSMGGYLAAHYSMNQGKQKIEKLVLASPAGVPRPPSDLNFENQSFFIRKIIKWWENGVTPGHLVRFAGPCGSSLVNRIVKLRFQGDNTLGLNFLKDKSPELKSLPVRYLHQITASESHGEHALSKILLPGAYAKKPLVDDYSNLLNVDSVLFVYGDKDWMNPSGGLEAKRVGKVDTEVAVVPGTHHVYLHESRQFDSKVVDFLSKSNTEKFIITV